MPKKLTTKERIKMMPVPMAEQKPEDRIHNINEVPLGYTPEQAMAEAERCLVCKNPNCIRGCPVGIDISAFIAFIADGKFLEACKKIKEKNYLPMICGRVCPQEEQCQVTCTVTKIHKDIKKSVQIGKLERFVGDYEMQYGEKTKPPDAVKTGKKVAIVGSGPAGLTVAGDLITKGHDVTIFEALHRPGGVLVYGIPEFRLPKKIVDLEVQNLVKMGVRLETNAVIGKLMTIQELFQEGYDAVFIGTGAGLPMFKSIPGENYLGVYSANEYLTRANLMNAYKFPQESDTPIIRGKQVITCGGGNVAMDSSRTALRLGAEKSMIIYRRSEKEMPARIEEIQRAREEGVEIRVLQDAIKVLGNEDGWVTGVECLKMNLGEPDESGRRRPVPIEGSNFVLKCDTLVVAIGNRSNPLIPRTHPEIQVNKRGNIIADSKTMKTSMKGVWAGGDIVLGSATVILAMGQGRIAANSIHEYLMTGVW